MRIKLLGLFLLIVGIAAAQPSGNATALMGKRICNPLSVTNAYVLTWNASAGCWDAEAGGGGGGSGTVTSVGLAGTSNQITVTGTTPITSAGSWTLSLSSAVTFPGSATVTDNFTVGTTFSGDSGNWQYIGTALSTPAAPTVVPTCTVAGMETCSETYSYSIALVRSASGNMFTAASAETTITNGPDTINATNFNSISTAVACPAGVSAFLVYQAAPNYGLIASHACGSAYVDAGVYPFNAVDQDGPFPRAFDSSTGLLLEKPLVIDYLGNNIYPALVVGTPIYSLSTLWQGLNTYPATTSMVQFSYSGTNGAFGTGTLGGLTVNTDIAGGGLAVGISSNLSGSGSLYGFESDVIGADGSDNVVGFTASPQFTVAAETIDTVVGFRANRPFRNGAAPTIGTMNAGFLNYNHTGIGGPGKDFSLLSYGGTLHLETGAAAYVGEEIVADGSQSAKLFQTLAADGTTVTSSIDAAGAYAIKTAIMSDATFVVSGHTCSIVATVLTCQ